MKDGSRLLAAASVLLLLSLGCLYYLGASHAAIDKNIWVNTGSQAIFFAAGIGSAVLTSGRDFRLGNALRLLLAAGSLACLFLSAYVFDGKRAALATNGISVCAGYFLSAAGCTGLMFSLLNSSWPFPKWLIYLGKISYGLYVFHLLALEMVVSIFVRVHAGKLWNDFGFIPASPLALLITIGLAALSYRYLERPFLRLRHRFSFVPNRPD
jgi:peptidoglycan/LPS O-acetylase OafA/YrhL